MLHEPFRDFPSGCLTWCWQIAGRGTCCWVLDLCYTQEGSRSEKSNVCFNSTCGILFVWKYIPFTVLFSRPLFGSICLCQAPKVPIAKWVWEMLLSTVNSRDWWSCTWVMQDFYSNSILVSCSLTDIFSYYKHILHQGFHYLTLCKC